LKKNLVLTGMMGVGKSTIGKSLSKRLKMKFIDTDKVIEQETLMTIKELFEKKGEDYFREIENRITITELKKTNCVIALGGGAFIDQSIRSEVLKNSISFWLDLDINLILKRSLDKKKRPLLKEINVKKTLINIYEKRKEVYNLANFKINCKQDINSVLKEIINKYEPKGN